MAVWSLLLLSAFTIFSASCMRPSKNSIEGHVVSLLDRQVYISKNDEFSVDVPFNFPEGKQREKKTYFSIEDFENQYDGFYVWVDFEDPHLAGIFSVEWYPKSSFFSWSQNLQGATEQMLPELLEHILQRLPPPQDYLSIQKRHLFVRGRPAFQKILRFKRYHQTYAQSFFGQKPKGDTSVLILTTVDFQDYVGVVILFKPLSGKAKDIGIHSKEKYQSFLESLRRLR